MGIATPLVRVDTVPLGNDSHSWVFTSEGTTLHNGEVISRLKERPAEGDIVVSGREGLDLDQQHGESILCIILWSHSNSSPLHLLPTSPSPTSSLSSTSPSPPHPLLPLLPPLIFPVSSSPPSPSSDHRNCGLL